MDRGAPSGRPKFSRGVVIAAAAAALVLAAAAASLLFSGRRRPAAGAGVTTSGARTTATYQAESVQRFYFKAAPEDAVRGKDTVVLAWDFGGAKLVRIEGLPGTFAGAGRHILQPEHPLLASAPDDGRTFKLKAEMPDGGVKEAEAAVRFLREDEGKKQGGEGAAR